MLLLTIDVEWARFHSRALFEIYLIFIFSREDEAENFEIMEDAVSEGANLNVIREQESQLKSKYGNLEKKRVSIRSTETNRKFASIIKIISKNDVSPGKDMLNNRTRCLNSLLRINTVVELRMF